MSPIDRTGTPFANGPAGPLGCRESLPPTEMARECAAHTLLCLALNLLAAQAVSCGEPCGEPEPRDFTVLSGDRSYLALADLYPRQSGLLALSFWPQFDTELEGIGIQLGDGTIWTYSSVRREVWECD